MGNLYQNILNPAAQATPGSMMPFNQVGANAGALSQQAVVKDQTESDSANLLAQIKARMSRQYPGIATSDPQRFNKMVQDEYATQLYHGGVQATPNIPVASAAAGWSPNPSPVTPPVDVGAAKAPDVLSQFLAGQSPAGIRPNTPALAAQVNTPPAAPGALPADYVQRRAAQQAAVDADRARMAPNAGPQIVAPNRTPNISRVGPPTANVDPMEAVYTQMGKAGGDQAAFNMSQIVGLPKMSMEDKLNTLMAGVQKPVEAPMTGSALSKAMIALGAGALGNNPATGGRMGFAGALPTFASTLATEQDKGTARNREAYKDSIEQIRAQLTAAGMDDTRAREVATMMISANAPKFASAADVAKARGGTTMKREELRSTEKVHAGNNATTMGVAGLHDPIRIAREFAKDPAAASVYAGTMHPKTPDNTLEHAADKATLADYAAKFEATQQPLPPREVLIGLVKGSYKLKQTADKKLAVVDAAGNPVK